MSDRRLVLLATARDWLGRSLTAVLEPSGFRLEQVASGEELLDRVGDLAPDVVMLDESVADIPVATLCGRLSPTADAGTPILLYSSGDWGTSDRRAAFDAGVWDHIEEPIRPGQLLRKLERLGRLKCLLDDSNRVGATASPASDTLSGLARLMSVFQSIAARSDADVGCAVLGPTRTGATPDEAESLRGETLSLVGREIRASDACAWIGSAELAVLLYGAGIDGLGAFVGRLVALQRGPGTRGGGRSISAGLIDVGPPRDPAARASGPRAVAALAPLEAARGALMRARDAGGGVRVAVRE